MNHEVFSSRWSELIGTATERWGALIHDSAIEAAGRRARLSGGIRARLASSQAHAARQLDDLLHRYRHWDAP